MLLQALHRYAEEAKLLIGLPFQLRTVHLLVPLTTTGELRGKGFVPLSTPIQKGKKTQEQAGREFLLPRFPGENNGGKAYFLAESYATALGLRKEIGESLPCEPKARTDRNPVLAFRHFWRRIADAWERTKDDRLKAVLAFRDRYLPERNGFVAQFEGVDWRPVATAREPKPEWHARLGTDRWVPLAKAGTIAFEVAGLVLVVPRDSDPLADSLWKDWAATYRQEAFVEEAEEAVDSNVRAQSVCLVTGTVGEPVARSHKPKILGVPGLASGGYVVSFAKEAPAFSSYGFEMGQNAPVSEQAAAAYALALNDLLASDDTSFKVGDVAFCFWAEKQARRSVLKFKVISSAHPKAVADFLKAPFAGLDRELAGKEDFLSVALSANAGRVVVREWMRLPLEGAVTNLKQWFEDLEIVELGARAAEDATDEAKGGPYSLFRLAAAIVRDSKELKRVSEAVTSLYRAALEDLPPAVALLEPLLAEFRSALVTDSPKKPRYPYNQSRFALLKVILKRNAKKGELMPSPHLVDTDDAAYNLGRLFCLLDELQGQAHEHKLEGAGVVERYYGAASSAPAGVFAQLLKLHNHHLRKVEQQGEKGSRAAYAIRGRIAEIVAKFPPSGPSQPPKFPGQLTLEEQGRFALGFYQQMAANRQAVRDAKKHNDAKQDKSE